MNPLSFAKFAGYSQEAILEHLTKIIPEFSSKLTQATAMGYTTDQVLKYFQKQLQGEKVDPKTSRYLQPVYEGEAGIGPRGKQPKQNKLSEGIVPAAAGIAGAAIGALTGGPAGAVRGATGAYTSVQDVLQSYDKHKAQGGSVGIGDFLKAAAKAVGSATLAKTLLNLSGKLGDESEEETEVLTENEEPPQDIQEVPQDAEQLQPEVGLSPQEAFSTIEGIGLGDLFTQLSQQLETPDQVLSGFKNLKSDLIKRLSPSDKEKGRDIVEKAFEFVKAGTETAQEETAPENIKEAGQDLLKDANVKPLYIEPEVEASNLPAQVATPKVETDVKPLYKGQGHPELQKYISKLGKIETGPRKNLSKNAKELKALKSSNVRYADYDEEEQKLQVLFAGNGGKPGSIYEYFDVPRKDVAAMMEGSGTAVTTGANSFRAWFGGKNPSIGRAFGDFIKKKDKSGDAVYPYRQISEKYVKDEDLLKVRGADKIHSTIRYVEAFDDLVLKSQAKTRAEGLKMVSETLKELPDDMLESMIFEVTKNIGKEVKQAKAQGKQKRFKGGRESEIKKRVESKAVAIKSKAGVG